MYFWRVKRKRDNLKRNHLDTHIAGRFLEVVSALSTCFFRFCMVFIPSGTASRGFFPYKNLSNPKETLVLMGKDILLGA